MNIALLPGVFFPQPGGAQVQTHNLANKLVKKGHKVDVILLNKTNIKNNSYKIIVLNKIILSFFFYLNSIFKINLSFFFKIYIKSIIKKNKYDVFHFQLLNMKMIFLIKTLKSLNQKIIVTFQGIDIQIDKEINYGYRLNKTYNQYLMDILSKIDLFLSISENIKKDLLNLGIKKDKIKIIPNSVELEKIKNYNNETDNIKENINLITVARFAKNKKGLDLIPKIAQILNNQNIKYTWYLVGHNSSKIKNSSLMEKFEMNFIYYENIENINEEYFPHSELIKIFKKCHLYINLSRIESFGITIIEGLASNLPVITFDTKGGNELVINNFNGIIVKDLLPEEMAKTIIEYHKNNKLYELQRKNTITSIKKYDLNVVTENTIKAYQELIVNN